MNGLIGRKVGMTQVFAETGEQIAVTVIELGPCVVLQRKTSEKDGYEAVQVGFDAQKEHRVTKPLLGHYKKAGATPRKVIQEFRTDAETELKSGDEVKVDLFTDVKHVDITGQTKGRGFQGVVKRWNFGGGRKTHGGHMHRRGGSIGQCVSPARVMKGRKMPGHMGNRRRTIQNLEVIAVRADDNALLIRGAVPGPNGGIVTVNKSLKKG